MAPPDKKYIFGPAPSRRLGRSLGIDLIPFKTCSYDCVYCQLGKTAQTVIERKDFAPTDVVIAQLKEALAKGAEPHSITISGSGEPTLHSGLAEVIRAIKEVTAVPVTVLTNGSLLFLPEVRAALCLADAVVPDLDAGSAETFAKICRPHPDLRFDRIVDGLESFGAEFSGRLLIEVFLAGGINDSENEVAQIATITNRLPRARVQLNTVSRPPAESTTQKVPVERLADLARLFTPCAETISDFQAKTGPSLHPATAEDVLALLGRRPCTLEDVIAGLTMPRELAASILEKLLARKKIVASEQNRKTYFSLAERL